MRPQSRRHWNSTFRQVAKVFLYVGVFLFVSLGSFYGWQASASQYTEMNEISQPLSRPIFLYILIDESLTANQADPNGLFRSEIADIILQFATAYGWLSDSRLFPFVYQYSTQFPENINNLWPRSEYPRIVTLDEDLLDIIGSINERIVYRRELHTSQADGFQQTLTTISDDIQNNNRSADSMVIVVTQGSQAENTGRTTEENLEAAASTWHLTIPLGVVLFGEDDNDLADLQIEWTDSFYEKINYLDPNKYILVLSINTTNPVRDLKVWDWMIGIYVDCRRVDGNPSVYLGEIIRSTREVPLNIKCHPQQLRLITMRFSDESFYLLDAQHELISRPSQLGALSLNWWEINQPLNTPVYFSSRTPLDQRVSFLYSYVCQEFIVSESPIITPDITSTATPASTPSVVGTIKNGGIGAVGAIVFIFLLLGFCFFLLPKVHWQPLAVTSFVLGVAIIILVLFVGAKMLGLWESLMSNIIAGIILIVLVGGGGTGGIILLFKKMFLSTTPTNYGKFTNFLLDISRVIAAVFAVLITLSAIFLYLSQFQ
ncbi:MAG: hypothetical protein ABIJ39_08430 [Chloroflexota bacterium]